MLILVSQVFNTLIILKVCGAILTLKRHEHQNSLLTSSLTFFLLFEAFNLALASYILTI